MAPLIQSFDQGIPDDGVVAALPASNNAPPPSTAASPLVERQSSLTGDFTNTLGTITPVPATYGSLYDSPAPGAVAGIVLGSVAGFLLLMALVYMCCAFGPVADTASSWGAPSAITLRTRRGRNRSPSRSRSRHHHSHGRSRSPPRQRSKHRVSRVSETVEVRTSGRRPSMSHGGARPAIIVDGHMPLDHESDTEEGIAMRLDRRRSISRPMAVPVAPPRAVHDSDDEDEVVVVEEHDRHRRRSTSRRESSGYRDRDSRRYSRG